MIAFVKTGATTYESYENGALVASNTLAYPGQTYTDIEFMGNSVFPGSYSFVGYGSDFMVYNAALTAGQLLAMAQAAGLV
jgi:hypothetical protein